MAQTIEEGKFTIETVGPVKSGTSKKTGKPYKTFDLQFQGDPQWYNCFWTKDKDPQRGEELEGKKEYNEDFKSHQFNMKFASNKANWNPAAANATVLSAAVNLVHDFLSLDPAYLKEWQAKKTEKQSPSAYYVETVMAIANQLKQEVVKMGGNEVQTATKPSAGPPANGDPGPTPPGVEGWADGGEEEIDLGTM